jgi:hypothetical protein
MTWSVAAYEEALLYRGAFWSFYIGILWGDLQVADRKPESVLDGRL